MSDWNPAVQHLRCSAPELPPQLHSPRSAWWEAEPQAAFGGAAPGGIGADLGLFDETAWEQALGQVQADFATNLGTATDLGSIDAVRLDSVGTFSNQADRALGGGDCRQLQLLGAIQRRVERVAVNADDEPY